MTFFYLVLGLLLLLGGAEFLVKGAAALATRIGVSPFMIGLTLVGFGTSSPELVASLEGAFRGYPGIAVGNVVGSNIANILLILGASGLIFPLVCDRNVLKRDGAMMLMAAAAFVVVCVVGELSRLAGFAFLAVLALYLVYTYRADKKGQDGAGELHAAEAAFLKARHPMSLVIEIVMAAGGLVALVTGASLLVGSAVEIAEGFGISDSVVGLTIVAVGTSLPELATSVLAALRRQADIAIGNVVGSNIFNVLGIAGVVASVKPVSVPGDIASFDIWVMAAASILFMVFAWSGRRIGRVEALFLLFGYGAYVTFLLH